jgi:hypothetical protein
MKTFFILSKMVYNPSYNGVENATTGLIRIPFSGRYPKSFRFK